jgi:hypothetical protein
MKLLDGERDWLTRVISGLPNDGLRLAYADSPLGIIAGRSERT